MTRPPAFSPFLEKGRGCGFCCHALICLTLIYQNMKKLLASFLLLTSSFHSGAQIINTYAGGGSAYCDGCPANTSLIDYPQGLCIDKFGDLYIASHDNRILKVDAATGLIHSIAGTGAFGYNGDGILAVNAILFNPIDVALDDSGNVYFSDCNNFRIRKITVATGIINTFAGNGANMYAGDMGLAVNASIMRPFGICFDTLGNLYIVAGNAIRKVNHQTGIITTVAGGNLLGYSGDGGPAINAEIRALIGICVDLSGNIYFMQRSTTNYGFIRKIDAVSGIISTIAGSSSSPTPIGDGGPAINAVMNFISGSGLYIDSCNTLYLTDQGNYRVRKIDGTTGIINTIAGIGTYGSSGDGGLAVNAELSTPSGICMDSHGNLFVSDGYPGLVLKISCATPAQPVIIGNSDVCTGSSNTYTVASPACGQHNSWILPAGWSISSNTDSSITALAGSAGGILSVSCVNACGSSVPQTLSVTVNPIYSQNISASVCAGESFTFPDGTIAGTATVHTSHLTSSVGCDSAVITTLSIISLPDTSVSLSANTLTASQSGAAYSWLDCDQAMSPVSGAINQSFTPLQNGSYALLISMNGCSDTSDCHLILGLGGLQNSQPACRQARFTIRNVSVDPNPSDGKFRIVLRKEMLKQVQHDIAFEVEIYNVLGVPIDIGIQSFLFISEIDGSTMLTIDLTKQPDGIYFLKISLSEGIVNEKIVLVK